MPESKQVVNVGDTLHGAVVTATILKNGNITGLFPAHVSLGLRPPLKWTDDLDINASHLTLALESNISKVIPILLPGLTADDIEYQILGHSPGAAGREFIHAHIQVALKKSNEPG